MGQDATGRGRQAGRDADGTDARPVRAVHVSWLPSGDDALIGLRTHDVFSTDRPLIGQPSTSHLYGPEEGTSGAVGHDAAAVLGDLTRLR